MKSGLGQQGLRGYLSLVLLLEFEAALNAAPRLQENLPLRVVGQVVDEQACCVHAQVQQAFGKNLHPREPSVLLPYAVSKNV